MTPIAYMDRRPSKIGRVVFKWPRRWPSTAELIRHLMNQHGLTRAGMVPILGTTSRVSEVLRGKKEFSMRMLATACTLPCAG
jgi:antitoxin component HigA of HigAB toxin-antitoxin module